MPASRTHSSACLIHSSGQAMLFPVRKSEHIRNSITSAIRSSTGANCFFSKLKLSQNAFLCQEQDTVVLISLLETYKTCPRNTHDWKNKALESGNRGQARAGRRFGVAREVAERNRAHAQRQRDDVASMAQNVASAAFRAGDAQRIGTSRSRITHSGR